MKPILIIALVCQPFLATQPILIDHREPKQVEIVQFESKEKLEPMPEPKLRSEPSKASSKAVSNSGWHRDCRSQRDAVKDAVFALGLGKDWQYIDYIFSHESCHDPGRLNHVGCRGLGQACPGSKLPCGPNDIRCQVKWFDGYARNRYGSWRNAHSAWLSKSWW